MPKMQKEIYCHAQHQRTRGWEGEVPEVRREKARTTDHRFPGKNLKKKLTFSEEISNVKVQSPNEAKAMSNI
jgi:hypothetical protein